MHGEPGYRDESAAVNIDFREEESDLCPGGFGSIRTMNGIGVDAVREISTDRTCVSLLGVGCAHQVTILLDGILTLERLNENRAGDHEFNKILEERALAVDGVEALCVGARQLLQAGSNDFQAGIFKTGNNLANDVLGDCIGLDNRKGTFDGHRKLQ